MQKLQERPGSSGSASVNDYNWPYQNGTGAELFPECADADAIDVNQVSLHETFAQMRGVYQICLLASLICSVLLVAAVVCSIDLHKAKAAFHALLLLVGLAGVLQGSAFFANAFDEDFLNDPSAYDTQGCTTSAVLSTTGMLAQAMLLAALAYESWLILVKQRRSGQMRRAAAYAGGIVVVIGVIQFVTLQITDGFGNSFRSKLIVWCNIRHANHRRDGASPLGVVLGFYGWILVSWCICLVFYTIMMFKLRVMLQRAVQDNVQPQLQAQLRQLRCKFTIWPLVFLLSWVCAMAHRLIINFVDPCFDLRNKWYTYLVICWGDYAAALLPVWNFVLFAVMNTYIRKQVVESVRLCYDDRAPRQYCGCCGCFGEDEVSDIWLNIANPKRGRRQRRRRKKMEKRRSKAVVTSTVLEGLIPEDISDEGGQYQGRSETAAGSPISIGGGGDVGRKQPTDPQLDYSSSYSFSANEEMDEDGNFLDKALTQEFPRANDGRHRSSDIESSSLRGSQSHQLRENLLDPEATSEQDGTDELLDFAGGLLNN